MVTWARQEHPRHQPRARRAIPHCDARWSSAASSSCSFSPRKAGSHQHKLQLPSSIDIATCSPAKTRCSSRSARCAKSWWHKTTRPTLQPLRALTKPPPLLNHPQWSLSSQRSRSHRHHEQGLELSWCVSAMAGEDGQTGWGQRDGAISAARFTCHACHCCYRGGSIFLAVFIEPCITYIVNQKQQQCHMLTKQGFCLYHFLFFFFLNSHNTY